MPEVVTGTNTEKIDVLIQLVSDLRVELANLKGDVARELATLKGDVAGLKTSIQTMKWAVTLTLPLLCSLFAYLIFQTITLSAELRAATTQLQRVDTSNHDLEREFRGLQERLIRVEAKLNK